MASYDVTFAIGKRIQNLLDQEGCYFIDTVFFSINPSASCSVCNALYILIQGANDSNRIASRHYARWNALVYDGTSTYDAVRTYGCVRQNYRGVTYEAAFMDSYSSYSRITKAALRACIMGYQPHVWRQGAIAFDPYQKAMVRIYEKWLQNLGIMADKESLAFEMRHITFNLCLSRPRVQTLQVYKHKLVSPCPTKRFLYLHRMH